MKNNTTPEEAALNRNCNSTFAQRLRLLNALKHSGGAGVTTIQARESLDIMMPAARIFELKNRFGYNIHKAWVREENAQGNFHRIARYVLFPRQTKDNAA